MVQGGHRDFVALGLHAGEVGLYSDGAEGGDDEQGRRLEVDLVAEQLVQGGVEVRVVALELPAEMTFQVGVGEAAGHPFLKGEDVGVAELSGRGVAYEGTQVVEEGLCPLPFAKGGVAPSIEKLMRLHWLSPEFAQE